MTKKTSSFLWILFIIIIPILYLLLRYIILPNVQSVELIMLFAPYLFYIVTFMYRIDERFYFRVKSFTQWYRGKYTSWSFSIRYEKIADHDNVLNRILNGLLKTGCTAIKNEKDFLSIFWQSRNIFSFRIEKTNFDEYSLHFYTSIIDVPFRYMRYKIKEFLSVFEKIENNINMIDRNDKIYEIEIIYPDSSPYYGFWLKTIPKEKIIKFDCRISTDNDLLNVNKNKIRYCTSSLHDLFFKTEKYLNLRGD